MTPRHASSGGGGSRNRSAPRGQGLRILGALLLNHPLGDEDYAVALGRARNLSARLWQGLVAGVGYMLVAISWASDARPSKDLWDAIILGLLCLGLVIYLLGLCCAVGAYRWLRRNQ